MRNNKQQKDVKDLIEQNTVVALGGLVLLVSAFLLSGGGSTILLSAILGVGVGGAASTRPSARPPSWTPRWPGFETEIAKEEELFNNLQAHNRTTKLRYIIGSELMALSLLFFISLFFQPFWPMLKPFSLSVMLIMSFLSGGVIVISTCWLSVYKDILRSLQ